MVDTDLSSHSRPSHWDRHRCQVPHTDVAPHSLGKLLHKTITLIIRSVLCESSVNIT